MEINTNRQFVIGWQTTSIRDDAFPKLIELEPTVHRARKLFVDGCVV